MSCHDMMQHYLARSLRALILFIVFYKITNVLTIIAIYVMLYHVMICYWFGEKVN